MPQDDRPDERGLGAPVGGVEVTIVNENLEISANAANRNNLSVPPLTEDDRTLRIHALNILRRATGGNAEVVALATSTGRATGVLYGVDEGSNEDAARTDPNRILWTRPNAGYQAVGPIAIPSTEGVLIPGTTVSAEIYLVEFCVVNQDAGGAAVTVSVGNDVDSAGSLAFPEYWMFNEVVPYPGTSGWRGPFMMNGDDDVRGIASAANDAAIHFRFRRVDTGA